MPVTAKNPWALGGSVFAAPGAPPLGSSPQSNRPASTAGFMGPLQQTPGLGGSKTGSSTVNPTTGGIISPTTGPGSWGYGQGQLGTGIGQSGGMGPRTLNTATGQTGQLGYWGDPDAHGAASLGGWGSQTVGSHPKQDAGDRRLENSAVNWGGFNALNSWINAPNISQSIRDQREAFAQSQGLNPTYNGVALNQVNGMGPAWSEAYTGAGATQHGTGSRDPGGSTMMDPPVGSVWDPHRGFVTPDGGIFDTHTGQTTGGGSGGGGGPAHLVAAGGGTGSHMEGATFTPGTGGGLGSWSGGTSVANSTGDPITDGYNRLLANGGSPYSASDRNSMEQQSRDAANRATSDALDAGHLDAVRRGDTSLSSTATNDARIRQRGANLATQAGLSTRTQLSAQAMQNLLAALQGASGHQANQGSLQMMLAELQAQQAGNPIANMRAFS